MLSKPFQVVLGVLLLGAAAAPAAFFKVQNLQLERRRARQRELTQRSAQFTEENRMLRDLLGKTNGDAATAAASVRAELDAARREVAEWERRARETRSATVAQAAREADALANNRDPLRGLTRLEYFTDSGQANPAAAFQTLGWAVINQPERIGSLLTLAPAARAKAEALIAGLPEEARAKWTPEKLGELFVTGALSSAPAIQIADVRMDAANRATLTFRIPGARGDPKLPLELGPNGWRVLIEERNIDVVRKKISQAGP